MKKRTFEFSLSSHPNSISSIEEHHPQKSRIRAICPSSTITQAISDNSYLKPYFYPPSQRPNPLHFSDQDNMCSVWYIEFDCGCQIKEIDLVTCSKANQPGHYIEKKVSRRQGFNCPQHGG
ncbi:hypothetical protein DPV78_008932 [Talaromyces pinophilus]|nr:hypothetical protein DPV78_008932 [Talaromyces pinophilus]